MGFILKTGLIEPSGGVGNELRIIGRVGGVAAGGGDDHRRLGTLAGLRPGSFRRTLRGLAGIGRPEFGEHRVNLALTRPRPITLAGGGDYRGES